MTQSMEKKILLIEDDDAIRNSLKTVLEEEGLTVLEAKNGISGLSMAVKEQPDLILLDILMPMMDGWEMLEQLREKDAWGKCVPVIMLTNLSADDDEQIRRIADLGPSFFMVKADWKMEGIVNKVLETLKSHEIPCP